MQAVCSQIKFKVAANNGSTCALRYFPGLPLAQDLHIDARSGKEYVLVVGYVGRRILLVKLLFGDNFDVSRHVEQNVARLRVDYLRAFLEEVLHLSTLALALIGIGSIIIAASLKKAEAGKQKG